MKGSKSNEIVKEAARASRLYWATGASYNSVETSAKKGHTSGGSGPWLFDAWHLKMDLTFW